VKRLCDKIRDNHEKIIEVELDRGSEPTGSNKAVGIVSYGVTSRPVRHAVCELREKGLSVEHLRIITNWPFPESQVAELTQRVEAVLVPELNMGQVYHLVREAVRGSSRVVPLWKTGGEMHTPQEIIDAVLTEAF
jgi:2-oxoglutarate ferredoxin oxidoreductase subunit alpha